MALQFRRLEARRHRRALATASLAAVLLLAGVVGALVYAAEQRRLAEASKRALDQSRRFDDPIVTAIQPATPFYRAEEYHQQFYRKNPARYEAYRIGCRRDARLRQLWGDAAISQGVDK